MESKWFIRFAQGEIPIPTKPRSRSVPDVVVLNSQPRFLRFCLLSANVFQGASFGIGISPCASLLAVLEKNHFAFSTIFL